MNHALDKLIVIGDRVLIKPNEAADKTKSGLFLPSGYQEKEQIQQGFILKAGPGYAIPGDSDSEAWSGKGNEVRYMPLQVREGDMALFLQKNAVEIKYEGEKYYIVPQSSILMVERDDF
ncbi:MAG: co-chaperone GroES family protein [Bacteroidales bacterium]|nr:co-chaperone GroES family protein [Bacteroidales bacterium]